MGIPIDKDGPYSLLRTRQRLTAYHWPMRMLRIGFGLIAGFSFVALLVRQVDLSVVRGLLAHASLAPLFLAVAALLADFLLRAVRFAFMLEATVDRRIALKRSLAPYVASFGVNDVLPLRVGDGFRVVWFSSRFAIPAGTVIGTMLVERILDLLSIVVIGEIAMLAAGAAVPPVLFSASQLVAGVIIAGCMVLLCVPALLSRMLTLLVPAGSGRLVSIVVDTLDGISVAVRRIGSRSRLLSITGLSLACWAFEGMIFVGAWSSLGGPLHDLAKPVLGFAAGTLGAIVPSLPGHFGAYEYFGLEVLRLVGVGTSLAAAYMLLAHLILWLPTAVFGVVWMVKPPSLAPDAKAA